MILQKSFWLLSMLITVVLVIILAKTVIFLLKSWKQPSFYIYISDPNFWTVVYMVIPWYFFVRGPWQLHSSSNKWITIKSINKKITALKLDWNSHKRAREMLLKSIRVEIEAAPPWKLYRACYDCTHCAQRNCHLLSVSRPVYLSLIGSN